MEFHAGNRDPFTSLQLALSFVGDEPWGNKLVVKLCLRHGDGIAAFQFFQEFRVFARIEMIWSECVGLTFRGPFCGTYGFSVRVVPTQSHLMQAHELRLITWS